MSLGRYGEGRPMAALSESSDYRQKDSEKSLAALTGRSLSDMLIVPGGGYRRQPLNLQIILIKQCLFAQL